MKNKSMGMFSTGRIVSALLKEVAENKERLAESRKILAEDNSTTKYYIRLKVQDGERSHRHHVLHKSTCANEVFAIAWYTSHYWGNGVLGRDAFKVYWMFDGEIAVEVETYKVLTEEEYRHLIEILYR